MLVVTRHAAHPVVQNEVVEGYSFEVYYDDDLESWLFGSSTFMENDWIVITTQPVLVAYQTLLMLSGEPFRDLSFSHNYTGSKISFESVRGRPARGTIYLAPKRASTDRLLIKLSSPPGRIKVCGESGAQYGYYAC